MTAVIKRHATNQIAIAPGSSNVLAVAAFAGMTTY